MCKIEHLKVIEFKQIFGTFDVNMVAMFNSSRIREDAVNNLIVRGEAEHNDYIVVMFKSQYERLFDLGYSPIEELQQDLMLEQKEQM